MLTTYQLVQDFATIHRSHFLMKAGFVGPTGAAGSLTTPLFSLPWSIGAELNPTFETQKDVLVTPSGK
jgi:hypothetical protein